METLGQIGLIAWVLLTVGAFGLLASVRWWWPHFIRWLDGRATKKL